MRRNLFLHFLNRDTREISALYARLTGDVHARALREPLNAAAMLCEDFCIAPPGFVIEDDIAFDLFEQQAAYLEYGLVRLPIRENNLEDYAEKKRGEYAPAIDRYSGLFNDSRLSALSSYGGALVPRKVQIGPAIVEGFQNGVDTNSAAWKQIRANAPPAVITDLRNVPQRLADEGKALTWSIMYPRFDVAAHAFGMPMREALQHVYFLEYCREFKLKVLADVPHMINVFHLPVERSTYSFRRFKLFLDCLDVAKLFLRGSAGFILSLRQQTGFTDLIDSYLSLAKTFTTENDLRYHATLARQRSKYDWEAATFRMSVTISDPTLVEIRELGDASAELSSIINEEHGFTGRRNISQPIATNQISMASGPLSARRQSPRYSTVEKGAPLKILVFVALEEELDVVVKQWGLKNPAGSPATGYLGEVEVDVICPRTMGRVAAAVAVTRYLAKVEVKPDLVICAGLAGGFAEEGIEQGAVICVDRVIDLAVRKVTDNDDGVAQSHFRRQDFDCKRKLYEVATSSDFNRAAWEEYCRETFDWPKGKIPSIWAGNIASADEVVASNAHRKTLAANGVKLLGIEMEAGGVCAAAKSFNIPVEVVRVVSDKADPIKTDDSWRKMGMKTLAQLLIQLPMQKVIELAKN